MAGKKMFALYTGGKDSTAALISAMEEGYNVETLVTIIPRKLDSYMFHPYNLNYTVYQAYLMNKNIIFFHVSGVREREVEELRPLMNYLYEQGFEGIVAGGLFSEYQRRRFSWIASKYGFEIYSPYWGVPQDEILHRYLDKGIKFMITSVAANGLNRDHLGWVINSVDDVEKLISMGRKYGFNPTGEGGEYESYVLYAEGFWGEIVPLKYRIYWDGYTGYLELLDVGIKSLTKEFLRV